MADDNYTYPIKPFPQWDAIGVSNFSPSEIAKVSFDDIGSPPVVAPIAPSPYTNPDFTGGGGGGGGGSNPTCATNWSIGTVNTSLINLPCTGSVSSLTSAILSLSSASNGISVNASSGVIQINTPAGNIQLSLVNDSITISNTSGRSASMDLQDLTDDGPNAIFRELDVCHMGQPGKRNFFCSEAYEA